MKTTNQSNYRSISLRRTTIDRLKREKLRRSLMGSDDAFSDIIDELLIKYRTSLKDVPECTEGED